MSVQMAQTMDLEGWGLRLRDRPRVVREGQDDHALERRDAALLAFLVLRGPMSRRQMAELLWPDASEKAAQTNLRQRLFRLRRSLGIDLFEETELLTLRSGLSHDLALGGVPQLMTLEVLPLGALSYTDCEPLAEQVQQLQRQWQEQRLRVIVDQAESLEAQGRLAEALRWAQHLVLNEGSSEHAHRRLMRLHYRRGDRTAALAAYRHCQQVLHQQLGLEPSRETRELAALIERSENGAMAAESSDRVPDSSAQPQAPTPSVAMPPRTLAYSVVAPHVGQRSHAPAVMAALWRPPRLVGREREWQQLLEAAHRGQLLLLHGEPGIGKTRLAQDFCADLGACLLVKASAAEAATPYAYLSRCLQEIWTHIQSRPPWLPDWALAELAQVAPALGCPQAGEAAGHALAPTLHPLRLQSACVELLKSCQALARAGTEASTEPEPVLRVLLVDDLQWVDEASLECLLPALARAVEPGAAGAHAPMLGMLTLRRGETVPAALQALRAQQADGLFELGLEPLALECMAELVQSLSLPDLAAASPQDRAEWLRKLHGRTGGRPLFILELLRGAGGSVQQALAGTGMTSLQLRGLIGKRLSTLSAPAQRLLRVAALLGSDFRLDWVAAVLQQHPVDLIDAWQELAQAQLVGDEGFAFDLAAEVAAESIPVPVARMLHAAIAPVLQAHGASAAEVAVHWQQAERWAEAVTQWRLAAQHAREISRVAEELAFLSRGLHCLEEAGGGADRFELSHLALQAAMKIESAEQVQQRIAVLLSLAQDDQQRLQVYLSQARYAAVVIGHGGIEHGRRALALAEALGDRHSEARAAAWLGIGLALSECADQALPVVEVRKSWVLAQADARLKLDFLGAEGYVLHGAGRYAQALAPLEQAAALAESLGDLAEASDQLGNLAICHQLLGQRELSAKCHARIRLFWERMGRPGGTATATHLLQLATSQGDAGAFGESLELLNWCLGEFRRARAPVWEVVTENRLARLYIRLGQWARARQVMRPLPEGLRIGNRLARLCMECRLDAVAGQAVLPRLLQAQQQWLGELNDRTDQCLLDLHILRYEDPAAALVRCDRLLAQMGEDFNSGGLSLRVLRADALRQLGRTAEAADQAAAIWPIVAESGPLELDRVEFWWLAAQAFASDSSNPASLSQAQRALEEARAWIERARPQVPQAFLKSFLETNPVNRSVLAQASWS